MKTTAAETDQRPIRFDEFFMAATGHAPFDYQSRLGCGQRQPDEPETAWLVHGTTCASRLFTCPPVSARRPPSFWLGFGIASRMRAK